MRAISQLSNMPAPASKLGPDATMVGRHQRSFLGLVQPVFHFFPGDCGALTAHDFQSVKLNLRTHCKLRKLRHKAPTILAASGRTQTKDFVIQRDEIVAGYF
jgi:hypothetical protein